MNFKNGLPMSLQAKSLEPTSMEVQRVSFKDLPYHALEYILQLVETVDLLKIGTLSKFVNSLVNIRLYQQIKIIENVLVHDRIQIIPSTTLNRVAYTIVRIKHLPKLINTIESSPNLAELIYAVDVNVSSERHMIFKFLSLLKLNELYCADNHIRPNNIIIPLCTIKYLKRLKYSLSTDLSHELILPPSYYPDLEEIKLYSFRNLVELGIHCAQSDFRGRARSEILADSFGETEDYQNLRTLAIYCEGFFSHACASTLFDVLAKACCKLNLTRLKLCDFNFHMPASYVIDAIDPGKLRSLEIQDTDFLRRSGCSVFLRDFLKHTTSLEHLYLFIDNGNAQDYTTALMGLHQNQLKSLAFHTCPFEVDDISMHLYPHILKCQSHLETLRLNTEVQFEADSDSHFLDGNNSYYSLTDFNMRDHTPIIMSSDLPVLFRSKSFYSKVRSHKKAIVQLLSRDPIYKDASTKMPFLKYYSYLGLDINVKQR